MCLKAMTVNSFVVDSGFVVKEQLDLIDCSEDFTKMLTDCFFHHWHSPGKSRGTCLSQSELLSELFQLRSWLQSCL